MKSKDEIQSIIFGWCEKTINYVTLNHCLTNSNWKHIRIKVGKFENMVIFDDGKVRPPSLRLHELRNICYNYVTFNSISTWQKQSVLQTQNKDKKLKFNVWKVSMWSTMIMFIRFGWRKNSDFYVYLYF